MLKKQKIENLDEKILIEAGLSEEQAMIYIALLEKGPMKASNISSRTGIKRGLAYKTLEQLKDQGLVSKKEGAGTVALFSPSHPSKIEELLIKKEKELALTKDIVLSSLGLLSSKYNLAFGKPSILFFEGVNGVEKILEHALKSKTEILTYLDLETIEKNFKEIYHRYEDKIIKLGKENRILVPDTQFSKSFIKKKQEEKPDLLKTTQIKIFNTPIKDLEGILQLYDNKVSIVTILHENIISILIEDEGANRLFKSMFEAIYGVSSTV